MLQPLPIVDAEVRQAASTLRQARRALRRGEPAANPLTRHRKLTARASFEELWQLGGAAEPPAMLLGGGGGLGLGAHARELAAWVYRLTLDRVLWLDEAEATTARQAPHVVDDGKGGQLSTSVGALVTQVLRAAEPERRGFFARALEGLAPEASAPAIEWMARRVAASSELAANADAIELGGLPADALEAVAAEVLAGTDGLLPPCSAWADRLREAVAAEAGEGWPAALVPRWLAQVFATTGLTAGLELEVPSLPERIGAASFARALGAFGRAFVAAAAPRDLPFALAHPAYSPRAARRGALFASLAAEPLFGVRALGLSRHRAEAQARLTAQGLVASLRLDAAMLPLRRAATGSLDALTTRFVEASRRALGVALPPAFLGVLPRPSPEAPLRLAGALLAMGDRERLLDRCDEDWFRNPNTADVLRHEEACAPQEPPPDLPTLRAGLEALLRALRPLT